MAAPSTVASETRRSFRIPAGPTPDSPKPGSSSAILLKLDDALVADLHKASTAKERLQFVSGNTPKLRIGGRTIDLTLAPDAFRNELYASTADALPDDFTFRSLLSHRAEVKSSNAPPSIDRTASADAALDALKSSLASEQQKRAANQVNIAQGILPAPKNRFEAARQQRADRKRGLQPPAALSGSRSANASGANRLSSNAVSSSTPSVSDDAIRLKAMRSSVIHLLAMRPASSLEIRSKTRVPQADLDNVLQKIAQQKSGKWELSDRAYKELDAWKFSYPSQEDRDAAIDSAVGAYGRLRLGKDDKLWQTLLPVTERGKGIVFSRMPAHLRGGQQNNVTQQGLTPHHHQPTSPTTTTKPDTASTANEGKISSVTTTPRLGGTTPRGTSSNTGTVKRLFAKNPQKARAAEMEKEKKRKEREAAASDREKERPAKRAATGKKAAVSSKIKSAEFVHSSDDESDEGESAAASSHVTAAASKAKPGINGKAAGEKAGAKTTSKEKASSSDSSDAPLKTVKEAAVAAKGKASSKPEAAASSAKAKPAAATAPQAKAAAPSPSIAAANKAALEKSTPKPTAANSKNNLSAPSTQHRAGVGSQRSPTKGDSRPTIPSPLGPNRARVQSDVSERGGVSIGPNKTRPNPTTSDSTNKGLGISTTAAARKRNDTVLGNSSSGAGDNIQVQGKSAKTSPTTNPVKRSAATATSPLATSASASTSTSTASKPTAKAGNLAKPAVNGHASTNSNKTPLANGTSKRVDTSSDKPQSGVKRKAEAAGITPDRERNGQATAAQSAKHRKTDSQVSVTSQKSSSSTAAAQMATTAATTKTAGPRLPGSSGTIKPQQYTIKSKSTPNGTRQQHPNPSSSVSASSSSPTSPPNRTATAPAVTLSKTATNSTASPLSASDLTATATASDEMLKSLTYSHGVALGEQFTERYYPAYEKLFDELEAKRSRGVKVAQAEVQQLWRMHERLVQMKREIGVASAREGN